MSHRSHDQKDNTLETDLFEEDVTVVHRLREAQNSTGRGDGEQTSQAVLLISKDGQLIERYFLSERDHVVGRSVDVDISLLDESISRQHAKLIFKNDDFILQDLDSKNGSFLNGTCVHECPLCPGDVIQIGNHSLRFMIEAPQSAN